MSDIIRLLPDSVANQIAAGEVIQRPASVVKELVENAIDAASTEIKIIIKDAGRTLIQIIDNGCGMSETDARMAFERHATSKITEANDLFALHTLGFRGEALASIAAVASVELRTRRKDDQLGIAITISGSKVQSQQTANCAVGSNFIVKNLFFNIPARRKFLKSNVTEFRHIVTEFQRIVLTYPAISFILVHNDTEIYRLPIAPLKQRIADVFGKTLNKSLISVSTETTVVKVTGFVGKPEFARKTNTEQFMFVNQRFIKSSLFHKAIVSAYENMLPADSCPAYFLYLEVEPDTIDINIHPTKTEVKFEQGNGIYQIIRVVVREALGKFNIVPSIDFNQEGNIYIPPVPKDAIIRVPEIKVNPYYNPFAVDNSSFDDSQQREKDNLQNWEALYKGISEEHDSKIETDSSNQIIETFDEVGEEISSNKNKFFQFKDKYIITSIKSGLMVVNQRRAHERILFEKFYNSYLGNAGVVQQSLYPVTIELDEMDSLILKEVLTDVIALGFDISESGRNKFVVNGTPADFPNTEPKVLIEKLLDNYKNESEVIEDDVPLNVREKLAKSLAKTAAVRYGTALNDNEMSELIDNLFACEMPNYTPDGKVIINIISLDELDKRF